MGLLEERTSRTASLRNSGGYGGLVLGTSSPLRGRSLPSLYLSTELMQSQFASERVGGARWAGVGVGLLGAGLVIVSRSSVEAPSAVGLLCAAGGLVAMTTGVLYENRFGTGGHPVTSNAVQYAVGLAGTLPVAWAFEEMRVEWTADLVLSLGYLAVAGSLISITLLLAMLRRGEASRVSAMFFLVPPLAALIAWALLGEVMPPMAWAGMVLAAFGVAVATRQA